MLQLLPLYQLIYIYFVSGTDGKYCDQRVCMPVCVCLYVCLYVCPLAYLKNNTSKLYEIFCTCYLWPRLDPPLMTTQYVMFFFPVLWMTMFSYNEVSGTMPIRQRYVLSSSPGGGTSRRRAPPLQERTLLSPIVLYYMMLVSGPKNTC